MKIIFICTGNTCRSPMAAAMAEKLFADAGFETEVSSAGISAYENEPASHHAVAVMREKDIDLESHRSRTVTQAMMDGTDLVLTLASGHKQALLHSFPGWETKVYTLAEYAGCGADVGDPFGMDKAAYRECADQIAGLLACVVRKLSEAGM